MKRIAYTTILVVVIAGLCSSFGFGEQQDGRLVHVILQADGPTDKLVAHIQSLGGSVKYQYRNVPAVAAAIPAERMGAVTGFPGVIKVEKDRMIKLHDRPFFAQDAVHPSFFEVAGLDVDAVDPDAAAAGGRAARSI